MYWEKSTFIIAEAGVNHNGNKEMAFQLIREAKKAGCDSVKFQSFNPDKLVSADAKMADYQKKNTGENKSQLEMLRSLSISGDFLKELRTFADNLGIMLFSTAFDPDSLDELDRMNQPLWKIPSGEITNIPMLRKVGVMNKPTILSTGMATLAEVDIAVRELLKNGLERKKLCILQCNTEYPSPLEDVNLRVMETYKTAFGCDVGYSDHTDGIEVPIAAVALGAKIIEKHFTLDRNLLGPDHKASLEPTKLAEMVRSIRNIEIALGTSVKEPSPSEIRNIPVARKSIVALKEIKKGELLTEENIGTKRPGNGLSPLLWDIIIGTHSVRDFHTDELIDLRLPK